MSIPNLLSIFRIILIPIFGGFYLWDKNFEYFYISAGILVISGLTDLLDGYIARHYNQITELGKILDPLADKLTQATVCVCLALRFPPFRILFIIFIIKEVCMGLGGLIVIKRGEKIIGSKWFGKVSTFIFYVVVAVVLFFPGISKGLLDTLVAIAAVTALFAFAMYIPVFVKLLRESKQD